MTRQNKSIQSDERNGEKNSEIFKKDDFRVYNPDNEFGFYTRDDAVYGEAWCHYCGGLTKKSLDKHLEECEAN
jgi:hypothetical protein